MSFEPLDDLPACSRSPFGKFDDELERLPIHSHIKQALRAKASAMGMSFSEYHRTVMECAALGVEELANLHAQRIRVIGGAVGGVVGAATPQQPEQPAPLQAVA